MVTWRKMKLNVQTDNDVVPVTATASIASPADEFEELLRSTDTTQDTPGPSTGKSNLDFLKVICSYVEFFES